MAESTHKVEVVPVTLEPHPSADSLSLVHVYGYTVVVRTDDWRGKTHGAYIPPDSLVPDTPEYAFLKGHRRIKVRKFRGVISQGLLVPAPDGALIGQDVAEKLGIQHYDPIIHNPNFITGGDAESPPLLHIPDYDVETYYRYPDVFKLDEEVVVTEKIHGTNARFVFTQDRMWCGSRHQWKKQEPPNLYTKALRVYPQIEKFCRGCPDTVVFGEIFGDVQDLKYGAEKGQIFFAAFDIMKNGRFLDWDVFYEYGTTWFLPRVPDLYRGPFDKEKILALADGPSVYPGASNVREGIVVRPVKERWCEEIGRVQLKAVSNAYLERA